MTECTKCIHARWRRTSNGRLHPDKSGICSYMVGIPELPAAFYWQGVAGNPPIYGGSIYRDRKLKNGCLYYMESPGQ